MDLSVANNWSLIFEQTLSGDNLSNFLIPDTFSSGILGIYIVTPGARKTWYTGGYVNQLVQTNLVDDSTQWTSFSQRLSLGGNVLIFPVSFASYQLRFSFPVWFQSSFISIWAYTGPVDESPDGELVNVVSDVAKIITDVTTIAEQVGNLITIVNAIRLIVGG